MTTLIKCIFCLRNGSNYVAIPEGQPVRCEFCKRVQPIVDSIKVEPGKADPKRKIVIPANIWD